MVNQNLKPKSVLIKKGFEGHIFSVTSVASFNTSKRFASSSFDGTARIWEDFRQSRVLFFFSEAIETIRISPDDNKILAVLGDSSTLFIHDFNSNLTKQIGKDQVIRNIISFSPDSKKIAFADYDDNIYVYDVESDYISKPLYIERLAGKSLIWFDSSHLGVGTRLGKLIIIDANDLSIKQEIEIHSGLVISMVIAEGRLISCSEDGTVKTFDNTIKEVKSIPLDFTPLDITYRNNVAVVAGERKFKIISLDTNRATDVDHELSACNIGMTIDDKLVKGTGEKDITIFTTEGQILSTLSGRNLTFEDGVLIDEKTLVFGSGDKKVYKLDFTTGNRKELIKHDEMPSSINYIPSKSLIISGAYDDTVAFYNLVEETETNRIKGLPLITTIKLSPNEEFLAVGCSGDNSITILDLTGRKIAQWNAHEDIINNIVWLDNKQLISISDDKVINIWKDWQGGLTKRIEVNSAVKAADTNINKEFLITGHLSGALNIWDLSTFENIKTFKFDGKVQAIKTITDSKILFASLNKSYILENISNVFTYKDLNSHVELIKFFSWQPQDESILTISHSLEIFKTSFSSEVEEPSPKTVSKGPKTAVFTFGPGLEIPEEDQVVEDELVGTDIIPEPSVVRLETSPSVQKVNIKAVELYKNRFEDLLRLINQYVKPELSNHVNIENLENSINEFILDLDILIKAHSKSSLLVETKPKEVKEVQEEEKESFEDEWKSIDWGKKR